MFMATKKATATATAKATSMEIAAHSNDSVTIVGWTLPGGVKIPSCLGFSLTRIDKAGNRFVIPTYLPPQGQDNKDWKSQPSTMWPIQRTWWIDFTGKSGESYTYEVEALGGSFTTGLTPMAGLKATSNEITLTIKVDDTFDVAFTRGVLSTQWLARTIGLDKEGNPDFQKIIDALADYEMPNNIIRQQLMGNVPALLMAPITECVTDGGHVDAAFYELSSKQFVDFMLKHIKYFSLILGNTGPDDATNKAARAALHAAGADITDRTIGTWGIPHNKSQVKKNAKKVPTDYTGGSTNITDTGMGCQSNMVIRIRNAQAAANAEDYWQRLLADSQLSMADIQSAAFRARNAQGYAPVTLPDGTVIEQYFQPSMPERAKPKDPTDLSPFIGRIKELVDQFAGYGDSILASMEFYPGSPSTVQFFASAWDLSPTNYVFMTVSTPDALRGVTAKRRPGRPPCFTVAQGREKDFADFVKELLKLPEGHAITHGKIVVLINKRLNKFVVIGGSDNQGMKASSGNDENAFVILNNEALAWFTFVNLFDVNKHYLARAAARSTKVTQKDSGWTGFLATDDSWQNAWLSPFKRKESVMLATGVWDGSGLVDPAGLKSVPVIPAPAGGTGGKPTGGKPTGGKPTGGKPKGGKPKGGKSTDVTSTDAPTEAIVPAAKK
jgi:hypothetical protein